MLCPSCGREHRTDASFCDSCGAKLGASRNDLLSTPECSHAIGGAVESWSEPDRVMGFYPEGWKSQNILEFLSDETWHAVESLPEGHRRTVIMADLHDMSYKEIADKLDCPLGTVMSRLHRGRRLLRDSLSEMDLEIVFS